jgi:hypothetical protein
VRSEAHCFATLCGVLLSRRAGPLSDGVTCICTAMQASNNFAIDQVFFLLLHVGVITLHVL